MPVPANGVIPTASLSFTDSTAPRRRESEGVVACRHRQNANRNGRLGIIPHQEADSSRYRGKPNNGNRYPEVEARTLTSITLGQRLEGAGLLQPSQTWLWSTNPTQGKPSDDTARLGYRRLTFNRRLSSDCDLGNRLPHDS